MAAATSIDASGTTDIRRAEALGLSNDSGVDASSPDCSFFAIERWGRAADEPPMDSTLEINVGRDGTGMPVIGAKTGATLACTSGSAAVEDSV
jgi:hypothetical protein